MRFEIQGDQFDPIIGKYYLAFSVALKNELRFHRVDYRKRFIGLYLLKSVGVEYGF